MSQENMEVVKRAIAAVNDRDVDGYLACCTADVQMENPVRDIPSTNLYDFTDSKIKRVRIFLDRREALEAAGLSE